MELKEHIEIFKKLRIYPNRNAIIRMIWHIANEHAEETTCEDFIKAISTPKQVVVEPIKEK